MLECCNEEDGMDINDKIREIEKIVDVYYKKSDFIQTYKKKQAQALFDILRVYDGLAIIALFGDVSQATFGLKDAGQFAFKQAHNLQDALDTAIKWIYSELTEDCKEIKPDLTEKCANEAVELLIKYADSYAVIADGYISYSRKANTGKVDGNRIIFDSTPEQISSFLSGVGDQLENEFSYSDVIKELFVKPEFQSNLNELAGSIYVENERLCYIIPEGLIETYRSVGIKQWNATSSVPQEWEFDEFSLLEFKACWVELYALSSVHFMAKIQSGLPGIAQNNGVIVKSKTELIDWLAQKSSITEETVRSILNYLIYDVKLKNTDIMYQPIVQIGDSIIITPTLIMSSSPERNLLSIINKKTDSKYSVEVNELEKRMCDELSSALPLDTTYAIGKKIGKEYPDIDFAVYDKHTNSVLLSEMKWLIAADSSKEVFEREKDIDHGCAQMEKIMGVLMKDPISFTKQLFQIDIDQQPDVFWCVITKHDIRATNPNVPVISLDCIKGLLKQLPLNSVFHKVRNKEYYKPLPANSSLGHNKIHYASYEFWIPALVIEKEYDI